MAGAYKSLQNDSAMLKPAFAGSNLELLNTHGGGGHADTSSFGNQVDSLIQDIG